MGRVFLEYVILLTAVYCFSYMGQMLLSSEDDWPAVERNLWRARVKWGRLAKILGREGEDSIKAGKLYMVVVQAMILFKSKTLVLTPWLEKSLEGFHHWVV